MRFTKSTTRALAASAAFVAAGATVAGAAAFQLPILGFGRANVASATASPARADTARPKVRPKVIVKTRYVNEIVHRRAPARAYSAPSAHSPTSVALSTIASGSTTTTIAAPPETETSPTTGAWSEDDAEHHEHDGAGETEHSADTEPEQAPEVDG